MFTKLNQKGLSLVEILISMGVMGAIGLGVSTLITQSEKKKSEMNVRMNRMTIEKMIENHFYSDKGCATIQGKNVGDVITLDPKKFPSELAKTRIGELRIESFIPTDDKGVHGIAKLILTLKEKKHAGNVPGSSPSSPASHPSEKHYIREIPVPVNVKTSGATQTIEDCNLNYSESHADIVKRICEGAFGDMTAGMSCAEAMAMVEKKTIEEMCGDMYGAKAAAFSGIHCDQKQIHANKLCPPGHGMVGFDKYGNLLGCRPFSGAAPATPPVTPPATCTTWSAWSPSPVGVCTSSNVTQSRTCNDGTTETRTIAGTKNDASCCSNWSAWAPSANSTCSDKTLTQTRQCTDSGSSESESQTVPGTKNCSGWGMWRFHCFIAGTQVTLGSGAKQSIEDVKVSDEVMTYDELTKSFVARPVKKVIHHDESESILYTFHFLNGETLTSNDDHLIYLPELNSYLSADEIFWRWKGGEYITLMTESGEELLISNIKQSFQKVKLYNIHVDGLYDTEEKEHPVNHNFFANGVLVHNEKQEWDDDVRSTLEYTCCENVHEKDSYPRGIFCFGDEETKKKWKECSGATGVY